jgi:hypothetical protein
MDKPLVWLLPRPLPLTMPALAPISKQFRKPVQQELLKSPARLMRTQDIYSFYWVGCNHQEKKGQTKPPSVRRPGLTNLLRN